MPVSRIIRAIDVFNDGNRGVATCAPRAFPCVLPIQLNRIKMTEVGQTNYSKISQIPRLGKTPVPFVDAMDGMGIDLSEHTLRERANETGAFYRLGRTMLITSAEIDTIFATEQSHRSKFTSGAVHSGPRAELHITAPEKKPKVQPRLRPTVPKPSNTSSK